ncbi:23S rRNA (pseudouridine(1915)-N(3))-methyltransferase RlmH [Antarcticibacterium flavum]|uniref:Ribosomal RNA large subunit methyltransferase H n=1 Tax=Antarcticibacterium flavum TaxID=2058175 RepID=A0A5B7X0W8_9FLAO|nr:MULTISPECIES: 23S rRNA (pseudouridine(1915)-N(3))-methyltransferase RlmH [Antarcticibacterium]MCM4161162.1 23S rRNA (pseudouridine(1915)-N(3))-methyltransferase RlmH [Antarcticibacterium sp. W02-3]QCY68332.1 23S rRNA (pseudouridine(1915)-N(3))-methyltransferase RlmH [Antarcticibacterium flavum]
MTIKLLGIGKTDDPALQDLTNVYIKRLQFYTKFELELIPDIKNAKNLDENQQKQKEGELLLSRLTASDFVVLLDENGKQFSSVGFSEFLQKRMNSGLKQLVFIIGGPYGFSSEVYQRADSKLSLSKMTFSHQMVRLFFVEQLYRGFTILRNEPYHHR